jgi:ubiquinone/menaquinone biosynthesis C-methylase UbiE
MRSEKEKLELLKSIKGTIKEKWDLILDISAQEDVWSEDQTFQIDELVKSLPTDAKKVLVVGCGDGTEQKKIEESGRKTVGIQVNKHQNELIRKKGLDARDMDMHEMSFKNKEFDLVWCKACYKQAISPLLAFAEFYRVSKKYILISEPDIRWAWKAHNYQQFNEEQFAILGEKFGCPIKRSWTINLPYVTQYNYLFEKL